MQLYYALGLVLSWSLLARGLERRDHFVPRFCASLVVVVAIALVVTSVLGMMHPGALDLTITVGAISYTILMLSSAIPLVCAFKVTLRTTWFVVMAGLSIYNVAANLHSIVSILSVKYERTQMPNLTYFRIVPNTAAAIGQSMTLISSMAANPKQQQLMLDLLNPLGPTMLVPEDKLPAATALASCGTAYAMRYIQAATQAGIELGLNPQDALQMVTQCVMGAAALLQDNPDAHPATEIEKVCTPGGYTIRGINELEHAGFASAIIRAIKASV